MRLTKEQILNATANKYFIIGGRIYGKKMFAKMTAELLEYKNIEEELGIDLITLFKALKNGVFVVSYDEGIVFEEPMLCFNQEINTDLYVLDGVCHMPPNELCKSPNYYFKDYGKTWALTKEELEK